MDPGNPSIGAVLLLLTSPPVVAMDELLGRWWNGQRDRLGRRDIWLTTNGTVWTEVTITDPPLDLPPDAGHLPHVYEGDLLCLYYPGQWKHDVLLARTILPWTAEWLLHYELWIITGRWNGGGDTHDHYVQCENGGPPASAGAPSDSGKEEHGPNYQ